MKKIEIYKLLFSLITPLCHGSSKEIEWISPLYQDTTYQTLSPKLSAMLAQSTDAKMLSETASLRQESLKQEELKLPPIDDTTANAELRRLTAEIPFLINMQETAMALIKLKTTELVIAQRMRSNESPFILSTQNYIKTLGAYYNKATTLERKLTEQRHKLIQQTHTQIALNPYTRNKETTPNLFPDYSYNSASSDLFESLQKNIVLRSEYNNKISVQLATLSLLEDTLLPPENNEHNAPLSHYSFKIQYMTIKREIIDALMKLKRSEIAFAQQIPNNEQFIQSAENHIATLTNDFITAFTKEKEFREKVVAIQTDTQLQQFIQQTTD